MALFRVLGITSVSPRHDPPLVEEGFYFNFKNYIDFSTLMC